LDETLRHFTPFSTDTELAAGVNEGQDYPWRSTLSLSWSGFGP
jgi:hypothetical protein